MEAQKGIRFAWCLATWQVGSSVAWLGIRQGKSREDGLVCSVLALLA